MAWGFFAAAGAMALVVTALIVLALIRRAGDATPAASFDLQVYRDQLKEVDRDLARGVIGPEDAERSRTEISRRILDADRALTAAAGTARAPKGLTRLAAIALVPVLVLGSALLYWQLGAPGYPDLPLKARIAMADNVRATRPDQATAEAQAVPPPPPLAAPDPQFLDLMEKLRAAVAARPDDAYGQGLLARNEAALGNFRAAYAAQRQIVALKGDAATAEDYAALADLMVLAAGGYVSPEAEQALTEALRRDPANGTARYYSGLMFAQTGRPDMAFRLWRPLLESSPEDAPWLPPLRAQIGEVAARAGVDYRPPAAGGLRGPTSDDVAAAGAMSNEDRQQMIRGMVAQLNDRLATEGGTPQEWARLIGAYGVLGETDRAREIWTEAQGTFADRPDDLATVRAAAEQAGVAE